MITNDMELLKQQPAIYAALLSPQGKIISTFFVINNPKGGFWLDCPRAASELLFKRLTMFRLRADVDFSNVSDQLQIALGARQLDGICFADPRNSHLEWRHLIARADLPAKHSDIRFTHMIAEQDMDFSANEVFPSDINMDLQNGIAWRKGCYVGQEVVSRMRRRGTIRKRICLAVFEESPPKPGADIVAGPATIGQLCSSNGLFALAKVRVDRLQKAWDEKIPLLSEGRSLHITTPLEEQK